MPAPGLGVFCATVHVRRNCNENRYWQSGTYMDGIYVGSAPTIRSHAVALNELRHRQVVSSGVVSCV